MYQDFFEMQRMPFDLTPNTDFFCELPVHQEALAFLQFCLNTKEGFIKIIGEVGSGKTLLCRQLINTVDQSHIVAYIPNPDLSPSGFKKAFLQELGVNLPVVMLMDSELDSMALIQDQLLAFNQTGKKVVLIIDEAQALSNETLETIRLLSNFETESQKLLHIVLFAQPELDKRLEMNELRQLKQRIVFSYHLAAISKEEMDVYVNHRLSLSGCELSGIFSAKARRMLYRASGGIPRLINILCHKALLVAYGLGCHEIGARAMYHAIADTRIQGHENRRLLYCGVALLLLAASFGLFILYR
jgi:MSHA biogenesis protein MshM